MLRRLRLGGPHGYRRSGALGSATAALARTGRARRAVPSDRGAESPEGAGTPPLPTGPVVRDGSRAMFRRLATRIFLAFAVALGAFGAVAAFGAARLHDLGRELRLLSGGYLPLTRVAAPVEVKDTVGAGDSFDAGFVYAYLAGWDMERALRLAAVCGSLSTRSAGGTAAQATLDEAVALLASTYSSAEPV